MNLYRDFHTAASPGYFSAGIHPWYIDPDPTQQLKELGEITKLQQVLAIGETGLDKLVSTRMSLQQELFAAQIRLAMERKKPLLIHCVRAWNELTAMLDQAAVSVPVILHGFNKGAALARQLAAKGYYFSFGKALEHENNRQALREIPLPQLFFETDDARVPIASIYQMAASALSIDLNSLSLQVQQNARTVFGPVFHHD